jgi:hypothetical protein
MVSGTAVVEKHVGVVIRGYRLAVERLREAHDREDHDGVFIALTEAMNWLASLADVSDLSKTEDVGAVIFARNRTHHGLASITYRGESRGLHAWRPATQLPIPQDPRHANPKGEKMYVKRLAKQPVLDVFSRLEAVVSKARPK